MRRPACILLLAVLMTYGPLYEANAYADDMWIKFGRGVSNVATGYLEIFNQMYLYGREGERWPIAMVGGLAKGVFYGTLRTLVGGYEVLTFPIPVPARYKPIMKPAFIVPVE